MTTEHPMDYSSEQTTDPQPSRSSFASRLRTFFIWTLMFMVALVAAFGAGYFLKEREVFDLRQRLVEQKAEAEAQVAALEKRALEAEKTQLEQALERATVKMSLNDVLAPLPIALAEMERKNFGSAIERINAAKRALEGPGINAAVREVAAARLDAISDEIMSEIGQLGGVKMKARFSTSAEALEQVLVARYDANRFLTVAPFDPAAEGMDRTVHTSREHAADVLSSDPNILETPGALARDADEAPGEHGYSVISDTVNESGWSVTMPEHAMPFFGPERPVTDHDRPEFDGVIWFDPWGAPESMKSDEPGSNEEASSEDPEVESEPSLELAPDPSMEAGEPSAAPAMRWPDWDPEASEPEPTEPTGDSTVDSTEAEVYSEDDLFRWPSDAVTVEDVEESSQEAIESSTPSREKSRRPSTDSTWSLGSWPTAKPVVPPG